MKLRFIGALAASTAITMFASPSQALDVSSVGVADTVTATVDGEDVYASPLIFNGTLYGWCVTPYRNIRVGSSNYVFNPVTFDVQDSDLIAGAPLNQTEIDEVEALVQRGAVELADHASATVLAANALAIWSDEGARVSGLHGALRSDVESDISWSQTHDATIPINVLSDEHFSTQSFAYAGAVPEPAAWALTMFGLAVVGGTLRARRMKALA
jgi:hypothetical protein